jgi:hypothetical protein
MPLYRFVVRYKIGAVVGANGQRSLRQNRERVYCEGSKEGRKRREQKQNVQQQGFPRGHPP